MIDFAAFFHRFGAIQEAAEVLDQALGQDIPAALTDVLATFGNPEISEWNDLRRILTVAQVRSSSIISALSSVSANALIDAVRAEYPQLPATLSACLPVFLAAMEGTETVEENVVSASVTEPGSGKPSLVVSLVGLDGRLQENALDETIICEVVAGGLQVLGEPRVPSNHPLWPGGSGVVQRLSLLREGNSHVLNSSFDFELMPDYPSDWELVVGSYAGSIRLTETEAQTLTITGTPTSGTFRIRWTTPAGSIVTTDPLPFDAVAAQIQEAIQQFPGLASVQVTTTGTAPNYVHRVEFEGVTPGGDQPALVALVDFDTGGITVAEAQAGGPGTTWRSLAFVGDGAELSAVQQRVFPVPGAAYVVSVQAMRDAGATGELRIELTDGTGAVLDDESGGSNALIIDVATLSDSAFSRQSGFFRIPLDLPEVVFFRVRLSTAVSASDLIYLDDVIFTPVSPLYENGPIAAYLAGRVDAESSDNYSVVISNDYAGQLQTAFGRFFNREVLPSDDTMSATIPATTTTTTAP